MSFHADLSPYTEERFDRLAVHVGWLAAGHDFRRGTTPARFAERLWRLSRSPWVVHRGYHKCEFCPQRSVGPLRETRGTEEARLGFGLIQVPGTERLYIAPNLVYHYVVSHGYQPPREFVEAVLDTASLSPTMAGSRFDLARLRDGLKPFRLHWFPTLRSTNDHAAVLRERGTLFAPAAVLTGRQTAGRGRGAHRWWSGGGGLTVTFVLPVDDAAAPHQVPLMAGLAVRRAAASRTGGAAVQLKWPNDLLFDGRKLGGLLCERVRKADLVGVGLNVNVDPADAPSDLRDRVSSLRAIAGRPLDMTDVLVAVAAELREVFHRLPEKPFPTLLREYDEHHALIGRRVTVLDAGDGQAVSGKCEGLDEMGRLLLRDRGSLHHVIAGQVVAH